MIHYTILFLYSQFLKLNTTNCQNHQTTPILYSSITNQSQYHRFTTSISLTLQLNPFFLSLQFIMGNNLEGIPNRLKAAYNPSLNDWEIKQKTDKLKLWQNKTTGELMEEYSYTATDKAQLYRLRAHFEHRYHKPYIVASKFFMEKQTDQLCSSFYETSMFLQYIGIRLNQFRDVTFPDCLHLYNACLHGFGQLQARLGYFDVSDNLVGLNQLGQVKVWTNPDFSKQRPKLNVSKDGETQMLKEVIELVESNVDIQSEPESISLYLKQNAKSFQQAVAALRQYTAKHQVEIPNCLQNINHLRKHGLVQAGPMIKSIHASLENKPFISQIHGDVRNPQENHQNSTSFLQAQAARIPSPILKPPSAMITANPRVTSVMYQPIQISRNTIASPFTRQNILPNPNNINQNDRSEQFSSIYLQNIQKTNNIKQSQIVSQLAHGISPEDEAVLTNKFKKPLTQHRPIYLSTPGFAPRQISTTAENIATLNKKYQKIPHPPSFSPEFNQNSVSAANQQQQAHRQKYVSNFLRNGQKRNPPIFTSLQGSNRKPNYLKGSQHQFQVNQFFNNTIIHSIENQVRRDEIEANSRLDSRRNKLQIFHPLKLTLSKGCTIDNGQSEEPQSDLKQSAIHVFSIMVHNNPQPPHQELINLQREPVRIFSQEVEEQRDQIQQIKNQHQKIYKVHYNRQDEEQIRYPENQVFNMQSISQQRSDTIQPLRYNYMPNYSFDKNYQTPVIQNHQRQKEYIEIQKGVQMQPQIPVQQSSVPHTPNVMISQASTPPQNTPADRFSSQTTAVPKRQQNKQKFVQQSAQNISFGNNVVMKDTIKNPQKVEGSLKLIGAPSGHSASEIISSIQEIRDTERQLREELGHFI